MPLKLARRHGSPYWYIRGSVRGLRVDESTGFSDEEQAEIVLHKRATELAQRSIFGDAVSRTFSEAALSYLTEIGANVEEVKALDRLWSTKLLADVGQAEIDAAAKKLHPGCAPSTLNRRVYTPAVAVLHHAARKKWCSKPVIRRPKQPDGRTRWIRYDEAERLIGAAAPHLRPLVIFLLCTGARLSEALYLDWADLDLTRGHVSFHDTKNGESRGVPLHPRAVVALANVPWSERTGAVFRRPAGKIRKSGRVWLPYESRDGEGGGQVKTAWAGMLKRAGITDFSPHDCRHTWATWHYAANRDIGALMQLGGWKTPAMVLRYAHVNSEHLAPSIGRLWVNAA